LKNPTQFHSFVRSISRFNPRLAPDVIPLLAELTLGFNNLSGERRKRVLNAEHAILRGEDTIGVLSQVRIARAALHKQSALPANHGRDGGFCVLLSNLQKDATFDQYGKFVLEARVALLQRCQCSYWVSHVLLPLCPDDGDNCWRTVK
jgi:hypothetical protein